ncbi:MAG: sporulation protein [Firmicutes bacterium HGW-Firmicutes-15]|nr:MAG: sporulation protein [Firmicutes bacterium HGW-Firmicutes-15]
MKISKFARLMVISLLIGSSMMIGGCSSAAKKPAQPLPSTPVPTDPMPAVPAPTTPITPNATTPAQPSAMQVANQAAMEASKVMEVNKAVAVVADNVIYIGLDLNANMDKAKSTAIEKNVMDRVMKMESGYTVKVTSDMKTVASIKTVAQGLAQGKPITSFKTEMNMIMLKMNPKTQ